MLLAGLTYTQLCNIFQGLHRNVKCVAFTKIASILLLEGFTSSYLLRTFVLRVPLTQEVVSNIKHGTAKATKLANVHIFLINEATVLPKYGLHNVISC